jgi:hypothetical protein
MRTTDDAFRASIAIDARLHKASFGGDRSAAGRYAAEQRWKGHVKEEPEGGTRRTTEQKLQDGPTNLLFGRDDKGMPAMGTVAELKKRYGRGADARSAYFRDKYNLKVEVSPVKAGSAQESAQLGALQALEELSLSLNNVGTLVSKVSVVPADMGYGTERTSQGSFNSGYVTLATKYCASNAELVVGMVERIQGFKAERGQQPSIEEARTQGGITSMFSTVEAALTDLKPFFGRADPATKQDSTALTNRASQRMGYSVMVHEFGHAVDWRKTGAFTSRPLSSDPSWSELESPSQYGRTNYLEKTAESFAAWWLFSGGSQGTASTAFTGTRDKGVKVLAPIFSQKEDVVKSEKIFLVFAELPKDNPVFVFVLAGFFNNGVVKARPENPWKRGYNTQYFRVRDAVLARKPLCYKCKKNRASEVDHVRPLINGGSNTVGNLRPVCVSCNRKSGGGERRVRKSVRVDAMVDLAFEKASFGGDRSAAGRYAAEQRWKGHQKKDEMPKPTGFIGVRRPSERRIRDVDGKAPYPSYLRASELITMLEDDMAELNEQMDRIQSLGDRAKRSVESAPNRQTAKEVVVTNLVKGVLEVLPPEVILTAVYELDPNAPSQVVAVTATEAAGTDPITFKENVYDGIDQIIGQWAQSSNDHLPLSLAVQQVTERVFGLRGSAPASVVSDTNEQQEEDAKVLSDPKSASGKFIEAVVRQQYVNTQAYFAAKGIKEVTLYRGKDDENLAASLDELNADRVFDADGKLSPLQWLAREKVTLRPLSSFTADKQTATDFAGATKGVVLVVKIPVTQVFSTPFTGIGCLPEKEFVVLGKPTTARVQAPYAD